MPVCLTGLGKQAVVLFISVKDLLGQGKSDPGLVPWKLMILSVTTSPD